LGKSAKKRRVLPRVLVGTGLVLIAAVLVIEAYNYPWGMLFGSVPEALPDPDPIVLRAEDADSTLAFGTPEADAGEAAESEILPGDETEDAPVEVYYQLGVLKIPALGVSQHVLEGTQRQLSYGVGHVTGTAGLGQQGNCAIAGHRPSPFRYLDKLAAGDAITLSAGEDVFTYTVYESFNVLPEDTWVLAAIPSETATLTLITCTPYLVSSHRLIVRARLTDVNGESPETVFGAAE
jgi:sortase A